MDARSISIRVYEMGRCIMEVIGKGGALDGGPLCRIIEFEKSPCPLSLFWQFLCRFLKGLMPVL